MKPEQFDIVVIGSGPGGHGAAIQAAKMGKRVAIVERQMVGGGAVQFGTIPSKTLREAVIFLTGSRQREIHGLDSPVKQNVRIGDLMHRTEDVVRREMQVLGRQFSRNQVVVHHGAASFMDPNTVQVEAPDAVRQLQGEYFVIAVGSQPSRPAGIPFDGESVIDSDGIFRLSRIPQSMTVVGGGPIGIEYACIFAALGTEVTLVDQRERILEFIDREVLEALFYHMRQRGVILRLGEEVTGIEGEPRGVLATTASNKRIRGAVLLYAVGRQGATAGLGLEQAGLEADDRGRLRVDVCFQTAVPHIYAVGDVVGFPALAATSLEQGRVAVRHALGANPEGMSRLLPYGLYTIPEVSMVGQTEEALTRDAVPYEVGVAHYRETARGQIIGDKSGMLKLLVHAISRRLLGVHIIGEGATELVHIGQIALAFGATVDFLVDNTFNYPTLAECYRIAALDAVNKLA